MADETVFLGGTVKFDPFQTITALDWHIPAPTGLDATDGDHTDKVAITWSAVTGASHYLVYRSATSGGTYTLIASPTATSYDDESVTAGTTYYYKVRAIRPTNNREGELSAYDSGYAEDEPLALVATIIGTADASLSNQVAGVIRLCGDVTDDVSAVAKIVFSTSIGNIENASPSFFYSASTSTYLCESVTVTHSAGTTIADVGVSSEVDDYVTVSYVDFLDSSDALLQRFTLPGNCQYLRDGVSYETNYYDDCP